MTDGFLRLPEENGANKHGEKGKYLGHQNSEAFLSTSSGRILFELLVKKIYMYVHVAPT